MMHSYMKKSLIVTRRVTDYEEALKILQEG